METGSNPDAMIGKASRRSRITTTVIAFTALLILAGSAAAIWYWYLRQRDEPLEAGWSAIVKVIAGDGTPGTRDGHVGNARFSDPFGVAVAPDGTIYVADAGDSHRIRRIAPDGSVTSVAGAEQGYGDGIGITASFNTPSGLAIDRIGNIIVADTGNNAIRRITPKGEVSTLAGDRFAGFRDGAASEARFNGPVGVAVDSTGRVIVADTYNDRIRAIYPDGRVVTIAGAEFLGAIDGPAEQSRFDTPCGVAVDRSDNIYVADTGNGSVRIISPAGQVSTLYATPPDGLFRPIGIAASDDGLVYVTDDRGRIVEMGLTVAGRVIAGSSPGFGDGDGAVARFRGPTGLVLTAPGRLVVADSRNALIRQVAAPSRFAERLPGPPSIAPHFDQSAFATQPLLWPLLPMEGPFEITGTMGELRGGDGTERFHSGLDVQAFEGTPAVAVRAGVVSSPVATADFGTLNESLRIGSLAYIHLRVGRQRNGDVFDPRFLPTYDESGRLTRIRVKRGTRFHAGDEVGTINAFNHVHLNVGWPGEELNPLDFRMMHFKDTVRPTIARNGIQIVRDGGERFTARKRGRLLIDGVVNVVVDAWDQADGNKPSRRLGLYRLGYQILNRDLTPAPGFELPRETIRFDSLIGGTDAPRVIYASGSGIPFYGRRRTRFLYVVTNSLRDGVAAEEKWDTTAMPPGDYIVRVLAADVEGNQVMVNRDLAVTITGANGDNSQPPTPTFAKAPVGKPQSQLQSRSPERGERRRK